MHGTLVQALAKHARERPDDIAIHEAWHASPDQGAGGVSGREITWGQLVASVERLRGQVRHDADPGRVLVLAVDNRIEFHVAFLAALAGELTVFPISPHLTQAELKRAAQRTGAWSVIGTEEACQTLADLPGTVLRWADMAPLRAEALEMQHSLGSMGQAAGQGSLLLQSSGSTGEPKIVRRSANSLDAEAANCVDSIGFTPTDRVLLAVPLHHSYGLEHGLLGPIMGGSAVTLHHGFEPTRILRELAQSGQSIFPGVPFMFEALVQSGDTDRSTWGAHGLSGLRRAYSAGGPLPPGVFERIVELLGVSLGQVFGSTEIGSVTFNDPHWPGFDPKSVGRPMAGVEIRILDQDDPRVDQPLPPGAEGQLAVRAPSMLDAYLGEERLPTRGGFFFTGDLGRIDEHGALHLTGRATLLINVGGRKVNPLEVEAVLCEHPAVSQAIVVPVEVTPTVSRLRAVIVPAPGMTPDERALRSHARDRLSGYKVPRSFEVRQSVPRSTTGKILRAALQ